MSEFSKLISKGKTYIVKDEKSRELIDTHLKDTTGNPHNVTKSDVGLSNVTNTKQINGLFSGTTEGNIVEWGSDGYTVKDSGFTIAKSVPANAQFTDTTYDVATQELPGLMSVSDKSKIDEIEEGATRVTSDTVSGWGFKTTDTKVTSAGTTLTTITASTDDITAGTTALATGQLYVVYE